MATSTKPDDKPRWATTDVTDPTTGQQNTASPPSAIRDSGWAPAGVKPNRQYTNWLGRYIYRWIDFLDVFKDAMAQHWQGADSTDYIPDGAIRLNKTTGRFEEWDAGTSGWVELANPAQFVTKIATGGETVGAPTGGAQGDGTINAEGLFVDGVATLDEGTGFSRADYSVMQVIYNQALSVAASSITVDTSGVSFSSQDKIHIEFSGLLDTNPSDLLLRFNGVTTNYRYIDSVYNETSVIVSEDIAASGIKISNYANQGIAAKIEIILGAYPFLKADTFQRITSNDRQARQIIAEAAVPSTSISLVATSGNIEAGARVVIIKEIRNTV